MKKLPHHRAARVLVLLALTALLLPAGLRAAQIRGQVADEDGHPMEGVRIEVAAPSRGYEQSLRWLAGERLPKAVVHAVTDELGRYTLQAPEDGPWQVRVTAAGHVPMIFGPDTFLNELELPAVILRPDAGLDVLVTDSKGRRPLPGARIWYRTESESQRLWNGLARNGWRPLHLPEITDDRGRIRLPRLAEETLEVRAWAEGFLASPTLTGSGAPLHARLAPGTPRDLRVVDTAGRPVPGVVLQVDAHGWTAALTDADGRARVSMEPGEGVIHLQAVDGRGLLSELPPVDAEADDPTQSITLPEPWVVHGRVLAKDTGKPLAGALVWDLQESAYTRADARGEYALAFARDTRKAGLRADAPGYISRAVFLAPESFATPDAPPADIPLARRLQLRGVVVDANGAPVVGAALSWRPYARWETSAELVPRNWSGAGGVFTLGPLDDGGELEVFAWRDGFAVTRVRVSMKPPPERLELKLSPGATVAGRVVGPEGEPVPGARLRFYEITERDQDFVRGGQPRFEAHRHAAQAAEDGRFSTPNVAAGPYALEVLADGFAPQWLRNVRVEGEARVDLGEVALERGGTIHGHVLDGDGEPLAGAVVLLNPDGMWSNVLDPAHVPDRIEQRVTGEDGVFRFENLPPAAEYDVVARAEGTAPAQVQGVRATTDPPPPPLELVLEPAARVHGRVVSPTGRPLPNVQVVARREDIPGSSRGTYLLSARTDDDGIFVFEQLPLGNLRLQVPDPVDYEPFSEAPVRLTAGSDLGPVRLTGPEPVWVEGRVLGEGGSPINNAAVVVTFNWEEGTNSSSRSSGTSTDTTGHFRIGDVALGTAQLSAEHEEHGRVTRRIELRPGANRFDLRIRPGGRLEVEVVSAATGLPVPEARVSFQALPPSNDTPGSSLSGGDVAGLDGRLVLHPEPGGPYRIQVQAEGFKEGFQNDVHVPVEGAERLRFALEAGLTLTGRVTGLGAAERGRVRLLLTRQGGQVQVGTLDPEGGFRFSGLDEGSWRIDASLDDPRREVRRRVQLTDGEEPPFVEIPFADGLVLTGEVRYNGEAAVGARVMLHSADVLEPRSTSTDHRGTFRFGGLEPGAYRVELFFEGGVRTTRELDLTTDETIRVDVEGGRLTGRLVTSTGDPAFGVQVELVPLDPTLNGSIGHDRTDPEGRFEIPRVARGTYRLVARDEALGSLAVGVRLEPPETDLGDLVLEAGRDVVLRLRGTGPPLTRARILLRDGAGGLLGTEEGPIENGDLRLRRLPALCRELVVWVYGYALERLSPGGVGTGTGETVIPVDLVPAASVQISVPALVSAPVSARMLLTDATGRPALLFDLYREIADGMPLEAGNGVVPVVRPGTWTVTVTAGDGRTWSRTVTLAGGEVTQVVLE